MSFKTCRKCDRTVPYASCGLCAQHQDPNPARTSEAIIEAARTAFVTAFVRGFAFAIGGVAPMGLTIQAGAEFARYWNEAAGFDEVGP